MKNKIKYGVIEMYWPNVVNYLEIEQQNKINSFTVNVIYYPVLWN